ncbi:MFS transporter [Wenzhouxiangella sp. C33]|uniref:MFS transporter n=2 Tax=Wenzhouxiangella limi TaxID=2707351 RepID=A0A845UUK6_9GAMM|nr:MFS transporter [Wenzhouxiangella limi]
MLPVTAVVPLLFELTEGRFPGRSELDRHLFMSANMAGSLLVALFAGLVSDRLGRRKLLVIPALFVYGGCLLLMYGPWPYPVQLGLRFVEGAAHMTALVLAMTMIADQAAGAQKGRAMGMAGAALSLGVAAGTVLGGRIGSEAATSVFLFGGLLIMAVAITATRILHDVELHRSAERLGDMARLALQHRALLVPYAFTFVDRLTVGFIISTVSLYFATALDLPPAGIGLAMAAFLLPYAVLTYPAGLLCDRFSPVVLMAAGSLGYGCFLIGLGFTGADHLIPVMAGGGIIAALMLAPSLVLTVRLAGAAQATGMGGFHLTGSLGFMLGPLLSVALLTSLRALDLEPYPAVFVVFGLFEIGCVVLLLPWLWRLHHGGRESVPAS